MIPGNLAVAVGWAERSETHAFQMAGRLPHYWRSLAPKRKVELKLDLVAEIPGRYTGPASRAYLYYTAEQKQWADPLSVEITRE